jgi:hypothetical protein
MKKFVTVSALIVVFAAGTSFAVSTRVQHVKDDMGVLPAGQAKKQAVNQMVDVNQSVLQGQNQNNNDAAALQTNVRPQEKTIAEWTNPSGKVISNHGMAQKLENQNRRNPVVEPPVAAPAPDMVIPTQGEVVPANSGVVDPVAAPVPTADEGFIQIQ